MDISRKLLAENIVEILSRSKTPLKAKDICHLIYKTHNQKHPKFLINKVIWSELRSNVIYNRQNYTYTLKNKNHDHGLKKNENINKILLSPLIYDIPDRFQFENSSKPVNPGNYDFISDQKTPRRDEWANILQNFITHLKSEGRLNKTINYRNLTFCFENPYLAYLRSIDSNRHENNIYFEDKSFQRIFDEITRDNIITETEKKFIIEKANEYNIAPEKVVIALDKLNFKAYRTFNQLVEEVCADGIITDTEIKFINEKAIEYNVDHEVVQDMLDSSIKRIRFIKNFIQDETYYTYILHYLLAVNLGIELTDDINFIHDDEVETDTIISEIEFLIAEISEHLQFNYLFKDNLFSLKSFLKLIGIEILEHKRAKQKYYSKIPSEASFTQKTTGLYQGIKVNNHTFKIKRSKMPLQPLYMYEFNRESGSHCIIINTSHRLYSASSEQLIMSFAAATFHSKLSMTNPGNAMIINKLLNTIDLVEYER